MTKIKCCYCGEEMDFSKTYANNKVEGAIGHKHCVMIYCNKIKKRKQN